MSATSVGLRIMFVARVGLVMFAVRVGLSIMFAVRVDLCMFAVRGAFVLCPQQVLAFVLCPSRGAGAGGGGARGAIAPQHFVSRGWICLCPPKFWQSLGISTFLPPPPRKRSFTRPYACPW